MEKRPLEDLADDQVAGWVGAPNIMPGVAAGATIETLFRVRDALNDQMNATNVLTQKIRKLTQWLVAFTVAMAVTGAFQVGWFIRKGFK